MCAVLNHGAEYDRATDEFSRLRNIIDKFDRQLPDHIMSRF